MTAGRSPRRFAIAPIVAVVTALSAACTPGGKFLMRGGGADPDSLIGLAPEQLSETLGAPEMQRREPPAEVWQYRSSACIFDLYLYEEDGTQRAVHYEARSRTNGTIDPAECLGTVVERPRVASAEDAAPDDPTEL